MRGRCMLPSAAAGSQRNTPIAWYARFLIENSSKATLVSEDWPVPKDVGQLTSFLGPTNYCRKIVKGYSNLVRPVYFLLRKTAAWKWTKSCQKAFDKAKETRVNTLAQPGFNKPFDVVADAIFEMVQFCCRKAVLGLFLLSAPHW